MKWLSNGKPPSERPWDNYLNGTLEERLIKSKESRKWYESCIVGKPQATETYTVEQLENMGMVGYYRRAEDE